MYIFIQEASILSYQSLRGLDFFFLFWPPIYLKVDIFCPEFEISLFFPNRQKTICWLIVKVSILSPPNNSEQYSVQVKKFK